MRNIFLFLVFTGLFCNLNAQKGKIVSLRADSLRQLLRRADTLNPFTEQVQSVFDTIAMVNEEIARQLNAILTNKSATALNIDSLLKIPALGKTHSADKRLWIFNWFENTGGSWKSNLSLVHYRASSKKMKTDYVSPEVSEASSEIGQSGFCSNGAWFDTIYKLKSPARALYLCLGRGISCNTCEYRLATVVELAGDSVNFSYPAFRVNGKTQEQQGDNSQSCFLLDARTGDIQEFEFDPPTQTLRFAYLTDDNTPVQADRQKLIRGHMNFNGVIFVGNGFK